MEKGLNTSVAIQYFFVTDRVKRKDIVIKHCPTADMIVDFFTKPLQGALFHRIQNIILRIKDEMENTYKEYRAKMLRTFGIDDDNGIT